MNKPAKIKGYRSPSINAGYDYTEAVQPLAGYGVSVADSPGGRLVSLSGAPNGAKSLPWDISLRAVPEGSNTIKLQLRIACGAVVGSGNTIIGLLPEEPVADAALDSLAVSTPEKEEDKVDRYGRPIAYIDPLPYHENEDYYICVYIGREGFTFCGVSAEAAIPSVATPIALIKAGGNIPIPLHHAVIRPSGGMSRALIADIGSGGPFVYSADLSDGSQTDLVCVPVVTYFSAIPSGTRLLVFNAETETTGGYAP